MPFNQLRNALLTTPALLGVIWTGAAIAQPPVAQPAVVVAGAIAPTATSTSATVQTPESTSRALQQIDQYRGVDLVGNDIQTASTFDPVTSVSQLSDVKPTDWAFQALQSLVERYGCIVGYPNKTFRGNQALSRYEFAAGLNACMDRINELIAAATADLVKREDLMVLQKLQEEFATELAVLRGRIDTLEVRTATLEKQQFSTTTKLSGEAIFNVSDIFGKQVRDFGNQAVFQDRVRLSFLTSFTGKDLLTTRLAAGNFQPFLIQPNTISPAIGNFGTAEGLPAFRIGNGTGNAIFLDRLDYGFALGDRLKVYAIAAGGKSGYYVSSTVNPFFEDFDGGNGAISTFAQESPIYRIGGGAGAALNYAFDPAKKFVLSLSYLAVNADQPAAKQGLFDGDYAALAQLTFTPSEKFQIALTYVNAYHTNGNSIFSAGETNNSFVTGTVAANALHTGLSSLGLGGVPAVTNSYGIEASLKLSPHIVLTGFGGFTDLKLVGAGNGDIWYYGAGLAFPDLLKKGNLGGIFVGREPYLSSVSVGGALATTITGVPGNAGLRELGFGNSASWHFEAFYKYQLTDNLSITPGIVWITNPDQDSRNDSFVIGTIRTTFTF